MIYHLALQADWSSAQAVGEYRTSTIGFELADVGFIHCSFSHQLQRVADAFYRGRTDVVLLSIDESRLTSVIREENTERGSELFPHIYGPLNVDAVASARRLAPASDGKLAIALEDVMEQSINRAAFDRAIAAWNAGDLDAYLQLYDETIRLHGYSPEPMDKATVSGMYRGIFDALDGVSLAVHDVVEHDDKICARFTMSGTHTGLLFGVPATGRIVNQDGITILRFRDGRCVERWSCADTLAVLVQIGAVTLPG